MFCPQCGLEIQGSAAQFCPECGASLSKNASNKSKIIAILLCFFLGCLGIHRFYVGKVGTGILQLLTFGGIGIWALIDLIMLILEKFTDGDGRLLLN